MFNENRRFYEEVMRYMATGRNDRLIKTKMEKIVY